MSQKLMFVMAPDAELAALHSELTGSGFEARPSQRAIPGLHVRIRVGTADEAEVERIASDVAPGHRFGPAATPAWDTEGYRRGL